MGYEAGTSFDGSGGATLGRSNGADIQVDDPFASSAHARIFPREEFMYIEDMGSTNGIKVNGRRVDRARLEPGDRVTLGLTELTFELD